MADFFVDHGAYATNIGTTPTWGVPQEGDGSAIGAASASSVAAIVFTANAAAGNTVSVCGVTFTAVASGATGNNFNVGASLTATLDNLVAAINASTTAVASGVAIGTPQLRNLVFARNSSGTTLQVMMRVGSATLNGAANTNCRMTAASWASSTTLPVDFAGGSGGCWGWLINPSAIGVSSSISAAAYGLLVSKPMVWTATPTIADYVFARTGSGKTITLASGGSLSRGNVAFPMNVVFDTNTKWTGDSGTGVITLTITAAASSAAYFRPDVSGVLGNQVSYRCLARGNFVVAFDSSASGSSIRLHDTLTAFVGIGIRFVEVAAPAANATITMALYNNAGTVRLVDCEFDFSAYTRSTLANGPYFSLPSNSAGSLEVEGSDFKFNLTGVPADSSPLFPSISSGSWGNYGFYMGLKNNRFATNSSYKVKLFNSTVGAAQCFASFVLENNGGLSLDAAAIGIQNAADYRRTSRQNNVLFVGDDTSRHQRFECWNGIAEWNPSASPAHPTLAALQPDGVTAYSIRMVWLSTTAMAGFNPFSYRSTLFNRLTAGARTIVQHLFFDTTRGIDGRQLGITVSYVDSTGKPRSESTHFVQDPVASGATWANAGSYAGFAARKLTLTTAYSVKQNTDIKVDVVLYGNPPGSGNADIYVDPEFSIT